MNREEAILREFNLYPLWQRREQAQSVREQVTAAVQPITEQIVSKSVVEKADMQNPGDSSWPELQALVKNCTACKLRVSCTQTVFGMGDVRADWLFVGAWPGVDEDAQGEPFAGQPGKLLDNMLAAIKLKRGRNVYITNIVKCYPPGNRTPEADEIAQCVPYLERQIQLIQPKLIVALGETAALLLGHGATLSGVRGKLHDYRGSSAHALVTGIPLIFTYDPIYLMQTPLKKAEAWDDLCLAIATMQALV
ncbi:Type-4 uracil-DNA glycosylase [Candidatus Nitrotoga sp. HW29]|uniref:uracil-DNA glycosylase n=1 Tax=Candidatus Nitrotoga sp. HW29 TaxID=2886963 RepID=UPI001EF369E3|nr:uracil-DNA glycosylase [Candidatus Nitrotoga sp. HW29]CAH1906217.1 Type-4 uracil-DNA glycosylase [Candidatus Nitrotoga sp. HW29]